MTTTPPTTVAILGTGGVGITLAKGFVSLGYNVVFGSRDVNGTKALEALIAVPGARAASYAEAARAGQFAVLALPWDGLEAAIRAAGPENLAGKLVIDPSNPLDFSSGGPALAIGHTDSAGELVQRLLPTAKVVKALNTIGTGHMLQPQFGSGKPDMLIAGEDAQAKAQVGEWLAAWGWRKPVDMGGIVASRLLEALAVLWISYGVRNNHWAHGFSLLGQKA
ncbi:MAG: NAD(P)-binding domain-containing protein [Rhodoferax sp.]|nr:NAD(P)-binding domain-containing protein [Rhodoferax sp.]